MKYLSKRSEFLSYIKEDSGPLANDIDWGDSLLGRLINASIRKTNIAINAKRIDSVIKLLNDRFDELRINATVIDNNVEISKRVNKLKISEILRSLNNSILSDESEVEQIIDQTDGSINQIDSLLVKNGGDVESTSEYDVDGLLVNLNNFLNDLRKGGTASSTTGTASSSGDISAETYNLYLKNLNYIFNLSTIKDGKVEKIGVPVREVEYVTESFDEAGLQKKITSLTNKMNNSATPDPEKEVCRKKIEVLKKNLETLQKKNGTLNKNTNSNNSNEMGGDAKKIGSKEEIKKIGGVEEPKQLGTGDIFDFDKLKAILRPLINYLLQKDKEYVNSFQSLFSSTSKDRGIFERHKQRVSKIYSSVKRQMSVNENMDIILSDTDNFAKKISLVYRQLKGKGLNHPSIANYVNDIKGFISTLNEILTVKKPLEKSKNELFKYSSFINEAFGDSTHKLFQKHLSDEYLSKWLSIDDEKKALDKEINELSKNSNKKSIVINGIDPIMEIVRLFNRAYKLHTWPYIPSGRSRGKVSQMTLREYDFIGSGNPPANGAEPGYGPWRNNKIFEKWEEAVTAIIANPDYQVIFDKDTVIQTVGKDGGKPDARINVSESVMILERKEGGGKTLLKFINEMMDGDKLYKSGAQAKFIKEYFGIDVKDESLGFKGDKKAIGEMADKVKDNPTLEFKSVKKIDYTPRSIHSITTNGASASKTIYMLFQSNDNNNLYFKYSDSFYHLKKCLNTHFEVNPGELSGLNFSNSEPVFYASIPKSAIIQKDNEFKVNSLNIADYNSDNSTTPNIINFGKIEKLYTIFESGTSSIFGLTSSIVTSSGDAKDGRAYNEYKSKVR